MSTIPESVTEEQFRDYILPYLTTARRGYVSKTPLHGIFKLMLYRLHTGCQGDRLPVSREASERESRNEPSRQAVYDYWHKWSADGSLEKVWQASIGHIKDQL